MRIETWLERNCPKVHKGLQDPATDEQIREAQEALSVVFPPEMLEVYRCHDGQSGISAPLTGTWKLLRLATVVKQWQIQQQLMADESFASTPAIASGPVKPVWWNVRWIPVASNGSGDLQCVDLDPAEGGRVGQVVVCWHDREARECVAGHLIEWLDQLANDMEGGKYTVENNELVRT